MSKNNKNTKKEINENNISLEEKPKHELKDLFSIDELLKNQKEKIVKGKKNLKPLKKKKKILQKLKKVSNKEKQAKKKTIL